MGDFILKIVGWAIVIGAVLFRSLLHYLHREKYEVFW